MKVSIIGQGYVGLTLAISVAQSGHVVTGYDINRKVVDELREFKSHVPGVSSNKLKNLIQNKKYIPTDNPKLIEFSEVVIIAVPTPLDLNGMPDLTYVKSASELIAKNLKNSALIVNESTSYPGTLRDIIKPIVDTHSNISLMYAAAPERVDPGNFEWGILNTPRIVSGIDDRSTQSVEFFYRSICEKVYVVSSPEVAEAAKLFENSFRQVNIALVNELSELAFNLKLSSHEIIKAAATKPFGFMPFYPGIGVGGHCIPIDPVYLSFAAQKIGSKTRLIDEANKINLNRVETILAKILKTLDFELTGKSVQLVGIGYKSDVNDIRESAAIKLMDHLKKLGANVKWHDEIVSFYDGQSSSALDPDIDLGIIISPSKGINFSIWLDAGTRVLDLSATEISFGFPKFL